MHHVLQMLEEDWRLLVGSAGAHELLQQWGASESELAGCDDLDALVALRYDPDRGPAVLMALARLAPTDAVAARTLLQMILPGLISQARRLTWTNPDAFGELVSLAWERIRTYPSNRTSSVAWNVLMDTKKQYLKGVKTNGFTQPLESGRKAPVQVPSAEEAFLQRTTFDDLVAAQHDGLISSFDVRCIIRTRLEGCSPTAVAADEDVDVTVVWRRRWRAERRLRSRLEPVDEDEQMRPLSVGDLSGAAGPLYGAVVDRGRASQDAARGSPSSVSRRGFAGAAP